MLATFCLRLACGLMLSLLLLSPAQVHFRFYRVQFLTALGLTTVTAIFSWPTLASLSHLYPAILIASLVLAAAGSIAWSLDGAPGGKALIGLTALALGGSLALAGWLANPESPVGPTLANEFSSAGLLGIAMTAMLMGHSYLIAPAMSLQPLLRLLAALFVVVGARAALAGWSLVGWTAEHSLGTLNEVTLMLPIRWGMGLVGPLVLGVLAWQTARIRSTQSATGILYVVVIFCFLGELVSQLLRNMTQFEL